MGATSTKCHCGMFYSTIEEYEGQNICYCTSGHRVVIKTTSKPRAKRVTRQSAAKKR